MQCTREGTRQSRPSVKDHSACSGCVVALCTWIHQAASYGIVVGCRGEFRAYEGVEVVQATKKAEEMKRGVGVIA